MALFDSIPTQAASLVTAALEDKGAQIQSRMLDLVNGSDGQMLAGLLFAFAIATGVIVVASGGSYLWSRYLLVGPPLFFFLTQVTVPYAGTTWTFADHDFPPEAKTKALRRVILGQNGAGSHEVSLFFQFWNVFMSDLNKTTLEFLNLVEDGSHLNFITKIERYMTFWNNNFIEDTNMQVFIRMALVPECGQYFSLRKQQADPNTPETTKAVNQALLDQVQDVKVFSAGELQNNENFNQVYALLQNAGATDGQTFSCQELWDLAVEMLRPQIEAAIQNELGRNLAIDEEADKVRSTFYKKLGTETSRAAGVVRFNGGFQDDLGDDLLKAVDWVIARSLFHEIWSRDKYADYWAFEGTDGNRATGMGEDPMVADQLTTTANNIQQFNTTEVYQFKGDYVNAAMSLPHFQGVLLMLLSASYPLFALAVVLPGRAGAIFTWMGLWAWVKMWDIGFGVVMMIDNILYALFPRGPNLEDGDLSDPGKTWVRIMEVDPNYASAVYYNLLATCMYAVPLATAVFVRGGGRELVNAAHSRWHKYSDRLAGSAVTFARSLQAQSYAGRLEMMKFEAATDAAHAMKNSAVVQTLNAQYDALRAFRGTINGASGESLEQLLAKGGVDGLPAQYQGLLKKAVASGKDALTAQVDADMQMLLNQQQTLIRLAGEQAAYDIANSNEGYQASESAVAARYFSHDFSDPSVPGRAIMNAYIAGYAFDKNKFFKQAGDSIVGNAMGAAGSLFKGGAK
ncbi:MAG: conjugal transfer protein TraG N-terminal domain-containing protein [Bdellovibrionales bacterium]|nr:conjugal transfer protein TraG N-terminal domain-containing protein [Bdellovibrionales bacterium]